MAFPLAYWIGLENRVSVRRRFASFDF